MSGINTIQRIRAAIFTAAICAVGFVELLGCTLILETEDPLRPVAADESVLHDLFPEIEAVTSVILPAGALGGLAYGDFDCDGVPDLAVGDPDQTVAGTGKAGVVHVSYGDGSQQILYQYLLEQTPPQQNGAFGLALAAGNFDGSRCDDLAIGAPGHGASGRVHVVHGHGGIGLYASASENRTLNGIQGGEYFGTSLVAGQFNSDDVADLAVGIPKRKVKGESAAGAVEVFYGGSGGLDASVLFTQGLWFGSDVKGSPETADLFGFALAAGDFDGNGIEDLSLANSLASS